ACGCSGCRRRGGRQPSGCVGCGRSSGASGRQEVDGLAGGQVAVAGGYLAVDAVGVVGVAVLAEQVGHVLAVADGAGVDGLAGEGERVALGAVGAAEAGGDVGGGGVLRRESFAGAVLQPQPVIQGELVGVGVAQGAGAVGVHGDVALDVDGEGVDVADGVAVRDVHVGRVAEGPAFGAPGGDGVPAGREVPHPVVAVAGVVVFGDVREGFDGELLVGVQRVCVVVGGGH